MRRGWRRLAALALIAAAVPCRCRRALAQGEAARPSRLRRLAPVALLLGGARATGTSDALFENLDTNRDGVVDLEEFMLHARSLLNVNGLAEPEIREKVYEIMGQAFDVADTDRDGKLHDRELEFCNFLLYSSLDKVAESRTTYHDFDKSQVLAIHKAFDRNGDRVVDLTEYSGLWRVSLARWGTDPETIASPPAQKRMRDLFARADMDDDGVLSERELQYSSFLFSEYITSGASYILAEEFDENSDGAVDAHEVAKVLAEFRREGDKEREHMAQLVLDSFASADVDGNGSLDIQELMGLSSKLIGAGERFGDF